jgi:Zn-dependent protease
MLLVGFGWAKPVPVNSRYFKDPKKGMALTALAGPVSNLLAAIAAGLILNGLSALQWNGILPVNAFMGYVGDFFRFLVAINIGLAVFNFLPVPPLDGSKIFGYFLKGKAKEFLWTLERYSWFILMFLFMTELPAKIIAPVINVIANGMQWLIDFIFSFI